MIPLQDELVFSAVTVVVLLSSPSVCFWRSCIAKRGLDV